MQILSYLFVIVLVPYLALGFNSREQHGKLAAYFLNNNPTGNQIVSMKISSVNRTVSDPVQIPTGGFGAIGPIKLLNGSIVVPPGGVTFSQDSVIVFQNYLFAVNPGSNTLSMFFINSRDPYRPVLVGTPQGTQGEFPVAVAFSPLLNQACVVNSGAIAGVMCFAVDPFDGLRPLGRLRPILLGQSTPPLGPYNTASDIVFNPSQTAIFVTIKGNRNKPVKYGAVYVYPVDISSGNISTTPIISTNTDIVVAWSLEFLGTDSRAILTDPGYGAAILNISSSLEVGIEEMIVIDRQAAICWSSWSPRTNSIFVMDGTGISNITVINPNTGVIRGQVVQTPVTSGSYDARLLEQYLYVMRDGPIMTVLDVSQAAYGTLPTPIQNFDLSGYGIDTFVGLAVYSGKESDKWKD